MPFVHYLFLQNTVAAGSTTSNQLFFFPPSPLFNYDYDYDSSTVMDKLLHHSDPLLIASPSRRNSATVLANSRRTKTLLRSLLSLTLCLFLLLALVSTFRPAVNNASIQPCPTDATHPTFILQAQGDLDPTALEPKDRTHWTRDSGSILPYTSTDNLQLHLSTPLEDNNAAAVGGGGECPHYRVPSSAMSLPLKSKGGQEGKIIFGVATDCDRIKYHLPLWNHWLPSSSPASATVADKKKQHQVTSLTTSTPLLLVLTDHLNSTQIATKRAVQLQAKELGLRLEFRAREAERVEKRYFMLAEEMWDAAMRREMSEGIITDWFVFA